MTAPDTLLIRLRQIVGHNWHISHLAHTSDTVKEAADRIAELERERDEVRHNAQNFAYRFTLALSRAQTAEARVAVLTEALEEAALQIEYLHGKFQETGSGNAVLACICDYLARLPAPPQGDVREVLKPFAEAAEALDADTPPELRAEDSMSIEVALYKEEQPTVGDLRRARDYLSRLPAAPQADVREVLEEAANALELFARPMVAAIWPGPHEEVVRARKALSAARDYLSRVLATPQGDTVTISREAAECAARTLWAQQAEDYNEVPGAAVREIEAALSRLAATPQGNVREVPGLRAANVARQAEWDTDSRISLTYRGNELAGETGEACNVIKKLERERIGIRGSRATKEQLAEELADVVICADLIAMHEDIDLLGEAVSAKFNATSEKYGLATRLSRLPAQPEAVGREGDAPLPDGLRGIAATLGLPWDLDYRAHVFRRLNEAADEIAAAWRVLEFYATEWREDRGTISPDYIYQRPADALLNDEGRRARDLLSRLAAMQRPTQCFECGADLVGPFCPKCNAGHVIGERPTQEGAQQVERVARAIYRYIIDITGEGPGFDEAREKDREEAREVARVALAALSEPGDGEAKP